MYYAEGGTQGYTREDAAIDEAEAVCHVVEAVSGQRVPKCDRCRHYGCEAFRQFKKDQERYEEEYDYEN